MKQIFKEHIHIVGRNNQKVKKLTFYDLANSDKILDQIETVPFELFGCWICEVTFGSPQDHFESKEHKWIRDELTNLSEIDDQQFSIIWLKSTPGDISEELHKEKEESVKLRFRKIKQQMI